MRLCSTPGERGEIPISRQDNGLLLRQSVDNGVWEMQVVFDNLFGCQGEPLGDADVGELWCLKHFEEYQVLGTRVLDVMAASCGDIANTTCGKVVGARRCRRAVNGYSTSSLDEEIPLVRGRVCQARSVDYLQSIPYRSANRSEQLLTPVDFPERAWLNNDESSREHGSDWESEGVQDLDRAAGNSEGFLQRPVVGE